MNQIVRRTLTALALVFAVAPITACTFGVLPRESHDPAYTAIPPCFSGFDICAAVSNVGFAWTPEVLHSAAR